MPTTTITFTVKKIPLNHIKILQKAKIDIQKEIKLFIKELVEQHKIIKLTCPECNNPYTILLKDILWKTICTKCYHRKKNDIHKTI